MLLKIVLYNGFKIPLTIIRISGIFLLNFPLQRDYSSVFDYKGGVLNG